MISAFAAFASRSSLFCFAKALLGERGLDEHGIKLETPIEADSPIDAPAPEAQTQPEQPKAKTLAEHHLQIMANKISHILKSDKVSGDAKDAFRSIIVDASNEAGTNVGVSNTAVIKLLSLYLLSRLNVIMAEVLFTHSVLCSIAVLFTR